MWRGLARQQAQRHEPQEAPDHVVSGAASVSSTQCSMVLRYRRFNVSFQASTTSGRCIQGPRPVVPDAFQRQARRKRRGRWDSPFLTAWRASLRSSLICSRDQHGWFRHRIVTLGSPGRNMGRHSRAFRYALVTLARICNVPCAPRASMHSASQCIRGRPRSRAEDGSPRPSNGCPHRG